MLRTGAAAPNCRARTLIRPVRGAASSAQATAPISGGVMKGNSAAISINPFSGVSVRATIQTSGSAKRNDSGSAPSSSSSVFQKARARPGNCQNWLNTVPGDT